MVATCQQVTTFIWTTTADGMQPGSDHVQITTYLDEYSPFTYIQVIYCMT
ncbi:hypothetical protein LTY56_03900 [Limosilactobacillus albertensis]|uniref:Uncharacterized protein n=2 Tax=Limosilactobacillus TaxID=2742598 RepID=A0A839H8S6_9LACO|nr:MULTISPECIES: hypothetical protein [Limosilactobacillus]MBC8743893.1 hypothetical protein [Lactobacillus sp. Marseille-P7033]MRH47143.1 hypothetical protein [Limosilactobacillus reuteri]MBB1123197.1 hypothetical protein [Limosilactobacillus albertensis]MCD7117762.1 hypothetical protein [Limosilactobacillus albertensis]MCD7121890.1 hypothetical protein [Limosilactobacillus albertensis]